MRLREKKQITQLLDLLLDTNLQLGNYITETDIATARDMLVICQENAIAVGELLEKSGENVGDAVRELENYCEYLFQVYAALDVEERRLTEPALRNPPPEGAEARSGAGKVPSEGEQAGSGAGEVRTKTQEALGEAGEALENAHHMIQSIKPEYEIVFLPYKAAMWDCMESIWKAACEKEDCRCFVVPIPYFEIGAAGASTPAYDGAKFPASVTVVPYQTYSLEEHRPDAIFIHNPYDDYNRVTSVHPDFYSGKLKQYTDMLVYVPYFLTGKEMPESHLSLPAYRNVDRIILQNQAQAEQMEEYVTAGKLLPLGSPKVDHMKWVESAGRKAAAGIGKAAGNKKVVMYNASLSGFLQDSASFLKKMKYVFDIAASRKDILLLYRPHPLLEATIKAMRPNFLNTYEELKRYFLDSELGILDENPDPAVSVAMCDAYIGEESSSITKYFGICGKPLFYLDPSVAEAPSMEERQAAFFYFCCVKEGEVWYAADGHNLLCRTDLADGETRVMGRIPDTRFGQTTEYYGITHVGENIYLIPYRSEGMIIYHIPDGSFRKIYLDKPVQFNFSQAVSWKNKLLLVPKFYPAFAVIDLENGAVSYDPEPVKAVEGFQNDEWEFGHFWNLCVRENLTYAPSMLFNGGIRYDLENGSHRVFRVGGRENRYLCMQYDGVDFWLYSYSNNRLVRWNEEKGSVAELELREGRECGRPFWQMAICGKDLVFFPWQASRMIRVDRNTLTETLCEEPEAHCVFPHYESIARYSAALPWGEDRLLTFCCGDASLQVWQEGRIVRKIPCRLPEQTVRECLVGNVERQLNCDNNNLVLKCSETKVTNRLDGVYLNDFLDFLSMGSRNVSNPWDHMPEYQGKGCGYAVFEEIYNLIRLKCEMRKEVQRFQSTEPKNF